MNKHLIHFISVVLLVGCNHTPPTSVKTPTSTPEMIQSVLETVQEVYVEDPDQEKLLEGALSGMLASLDPYSTYLNPVNYQLFNEIAQGQFGGIGLEVAYENGLIKIISPMDDSPAKEAGLLPGDIITHVDSRFLKNMTYEDMIMKLHGEIGTNVTLTIQRGKLAPFDAKLVRKLISTQPLKLMILNECLVIRFGYFHEKASQNLGDEIEKNAKVLGKNLKGLILDIRNNPGGTLEQAVSVSNLFLEKGDIVHIKSRNDTEGQTIKATGKDILKGLPIIILINKGSASASEILAAALQDHKRAIILGEPSFGKGSVQAVYPLHNKGAIKLTVARFYSPLMKKIEGQGVIPDIDVVEKDTGTTPPKSNEIDKNDPYIQRALELIRGLFIFKNKNGS